MRTFPLRLLGSSTALLWGLQLAFLNPALALVLTELFDASTSEIGWALALYNVSGLIATTIIPTRADRTGQYLRPMLVSALLTIMLAALLAVSTALPLAVAALVVLGGPAGVGSTLLFAHLRHAGSSGSQIVNARALMSVAWVAGPPLITFLIGAFGARSALLAIGLTGALSFIITALLDRASARTAPETGGTPEKIAGPLPGRRGTVLIVIGFVFLQAANASALAFLPVYVSQDLELDVVWGGITLGVAAGLEVPALMIIGKLSDKVTARTLISLGCAVGVVYYTLLAVVQTPVGLIAIQPLNAVCFATVSGTGMLLFQQIIARPGLAISLYMNARRIGAILSGGVIAFGAMTALGQSGIFLVCALLTALGIAAIMLAYRLRSPTLET